MHRSIPRPLAALGALTAVALAGGCSAATPDRPVPAAHPVLVAGPAPTYALSGGQARLLSDGSVVLPLDAYDGFASPTDRTLLETATTHLEQTCMQAKGYQLPAGLSAQFIPEPLSTLSMYGVSTTQEARSFGYREPDTGDSATTTAQADVPPAVLTAFQGGGDGTGGCRAEAFQQLNFAATGAAFAFVQNLRVEALLDLGSNSHFMRVTASWSACMAGAGYHYANPLQPGRDVSLLSAGSVVPAGDQFAPEPTGAEKAAANDDVACKYRTGYLQAFTRLAAQYQEQLIKENATRLQQIRALWTTILGRARGISAETNPVR
jgi:hypothetical protein